MRIVSDISIEARFLRWASVAVALVVSLATPVFAQSVGVSVPGTANPYLSGLPNGTTCCSGDSAPAQSPVRVTGLPITPGSALTFSASGGVDFAGGAPAQGPDGSFIFSTAS